MLFNTFFVGALAAFTAVAASPALLEKRQSDSTIIDTLNTLQSTLTPLESRSLPCFNAPSLACR